MTPTRAARICGHPGCPAFVPCPTHTLTRDQRQAKDPAQAKHYSSARWTKISLLVRRRDPFCKTCHRNRSQEVHHKDNDWRNNDLANLEGICRPCHRTVSGQQHRAEAGQ